MPEIWFNHPKRYSNLADNDLAIDALLQFALVYYVTDNLDLVYSVTDNLAESATR